MSILLFRFFYLFLKPLLLQPIFREKKKKNTYRNKENNRKKQEEGNSMVSCAGMCTLEQGEKKDIGPAEAVEKKEKEKTKN